MIPRTKSRGAAALLAAAGLLTAGLATASPAPAAPPQDGTERAATARGGDDTPKHPLKIKAKRDAQKEAALQRKLEGKEPSPRARAQTRTCRSSSRAPTRSSSCSRSSARRSTRSSRARPLAEPAAAGASTARVHNEIPAPNRRKDNSTLWQADYDQAHYEDMYFNRMAEYYETQSSGRYSVDGDVTEWVKVPFNQALYGRDYCGDIVCGRTNALVRDALAVWVAEPARRRVQNMAADPRRTSTTFDVQDRYDVDGDGNYEEPDGFIDHFQIVHAGGDQAAGDPIYGSDAIWSHRWYANLQDGGPGGLPGVNVGSNGGAFSSDDGAEQPDRRLGG